MSFNRREAFEENVSLLVSASGTAMEIGLVCMHARKLWPALRILAWDPFVKQRVLKKNPLIGLPM